MSILATPLTNAELYGRNGARSLGMNPDAPAALAQTSCPDCGREWPARFGAHNCNFHRPYVHRGAIILQPGAPLSESVARLAVRLEGEVKRSAECANLAGEPSPYPATLGDIDLTIGDLKRLRARVQALAGHTHRWDSNDYCEICGADGRA